MNISNIICYALTIGAILYCGFRLFNIHENQRRKDEFKSSTITNFVKQYRQFVAENESLIVCQRLAGNKVEFVFDVEKNYPKIWEIAAKSSDEFHGFVYILMDIESMISMLYDIPCKLQKNGDQGIKLVSYI